MVYVECMSGIFNIPSGSLEIFTMLMTTNTPNTKSKRWFYTFCYCKTIKQPNNINLKTNCLYQMAT